MIVSAIITGSTMIRTYHSTASTATRAAAQTSIRHDQPAARSRFAGTGGRFIEALVGTYGCSG